MTNQQTIAMMAARLYTLDTQMSFADAVHDAMAMWNEVAKQIASENCLAVIVETDEPVARCDAEQVPA